MTTQQIIPGTRTPLADKIDEALQILQKAVDIYQPSTTYACFSGGRDSMVIADLMTRHYSASLDGILHIDTGVGAQCTRDFVEWICNDRGWPLTIYAAEDYIDGNGQPDPQRYEDLVIPPKVRSGELTWLERGGFPGPTETGHRKMFDRLKGRSIGQAVRESKRPVDGPERTPPADVWLSRQGWDLPRREEKLVQLAQTVDKELKYRQGGRHKKNDRILLVTGVYADESARRWSTTTQSNPINRDGAQLWANPLTSWTTEHMAEYRQTYGLSRTRTPAYDTAGFSLECGCGAFAQDGELSKIEAADPELHDRICDLQECASEYGYCWGYEEGPPDEVVAAKKMLRDSGDGQVELDVSAAESNLCHSCGFWGERRDLDTFRKVWGDRQQMSKSIRDAMTEIKDREPTDD